MFDEMIDEDEYTDDQGDETPDQSPQQVTYRPIVTQESGLCALLGIPAASIWATAVTGYRADVWRHDTDGTSQPWSSKHFPPTDAGYNAAQQWAAKEAAAYAAYH